MKNNDFHKGITLTALGSFWWGVIGVIYFEFIAFVGHIEVVLHRCIWTALFLIITTTFFSKWKIFFTTIKNYKTLIQDIEKDVNLKNILSKKDDFELEETLSDLMLELKEMNHLKKIEFLENKVAKNLDEGSYSELIKLKSQLNSE